MTRARQHEERRRGAILFGVGLILAAHAPAPAGAATWTVPSEAPTIQAAIGLAATGDTVEVEPGTYTGAGNRNLDFGGKLLVMRSIAGAAATILDLQSSGRALVFQNGEGNAAVVEGFTFTNGRTQQGGAILCHGASPTVVDCVLLANRADETGGGFALRIGAAPRLLRCRLEGNSAFFSGGGISCIDASAEITECVFATNQAGLLGGGLYCRNASPTITGSSFVDNRSNGAGGGVVFYHLSAPMVTSCTIAANRAVGSAGAAFCDDGATPTFVGCLVTGNHSDGNGGAILSVGRSAVTLRGSTVSGNRALQRGGGLYAESVSSFALERSILWGNCAPTDDEAHLVDAASGITFDCCDVDSAGVGGTGSVSYSGDDLFTDPGFCSPQDCVAAPTSGGDYGLRSDSPCLAAASPCASLIGARGQACAVTAVGSRGLAARGWLRISPSPFLRDALIEYALPGPGPVRIDVYDATGRRVRSTSVDAPRGTLSWDGNGADGRSVPPGSYLVLVTGAQHSQTGRAVRVR